MKQLNLLVFILLCAHAQAQFKNIQLDLSGAYEPSIAINKYNTQNIVSSGAPDNIYYTFNGGLSWEKTKLTSPYGISGNLILISDFKGNFYCLHQSAIRNKSQIAIQESKDGGKTWSESALISSDTSKYATKPAITVTRKGDFYVTWTEFDIYKSENENCQSRILLSKSSNGRKWSKPFEISQAKGNCKDDDQTAAGATPAVMGDGQRAFVAWANQEKIFFDRAFDGGDTWLSNDIMIATQTGGWRMQVPGINDASGLPALVIDNTKKMKLTGALYLIWSDQLQTGKDTEIRFMRSMDFGDIWSQTVRVNNDKTISHQYAPCIALDSETGFIYILYLDRRAHSDANTDVYIAYSTDAGTTFKNVKISETPFLSAESVISHHPTGIAAQGGVITPIWTRTDNSNMEIVMCVLKHEELEKIK